jgi:outer membrane protein assembly factor BamB
VLAEGELLWLRLADGSIDARHELDAPSGDAPVPHRPTFAVPAGDLLVAPTGPAVLDHQGSVRWHGGADGRLVGVHGGVVVVDGESLRGLELATGEVRWERTGTEGSAISPAAALVGDTLVMVDAGRAVGLDPATGVERWRSPLPGDAAVGAGARLAGLTDDVAFVAYEQGDVEVVVRVGGRDGRLEPVGELGGVNGFPVQVSVAGGTVVSSGGREGVRAHRDGELLWSADVEQLPGTATVVDDDVVVLEGHRLRGLDLRTGKTRWTVATPMVGSLPARPAVLHGQAVVMAHSRLRAVDPATGETAWEEPVVGGSRCCPDHLVGPDHVVTAGPVRVFDAAGEQRWAEVPESSARPQSSAVAIVGPWVLTQRFEPSNGAEFPLRGLEDGRQGPTIGVEGMDPQVVHDDARFHAVARIGGRRALAAFPIPALDTGDATVTPSWVIDQPAEVQLVRTGDELLVVGRVSVERRDPATGELLGRTPLPALVQPGVAVSDGTLVGLTAADTLAAIDVATGELRWRRTFAVPLGSSPTVAGDRVYVTDVKSVLRVLSLRDGDETATTELRLPAAGTVTVAHGLVLVPTERALVAVGPPVDRSDAAARVR